MAQGKGTTWGWTIPVVGAATLSPQTTYMSPAMTQPQPVTKTRAATTQSAFEIRDKLMDAKLEAVEARTDTKFAQLLGELKLITSNLGNLDTRVGDLKADVAAVSTATAGVKWNILATGLVLGGLIIAIAAFGVQILDFATGLVGAGK